MGGILKAVLEGAAKAAGHHIEGKHEMNCPMCKGTGRQANKKCQHCKGRDRLTILT